MISPVRCWPEATASKSTTSAAIELDKNRIDANELPRVIGAPQFWQAALGDSFSLEIPRICKSYLELLACFFIFVGSLGLAITLGRREELN